MGHPGHWALLCIFDTPQGDSPLPERCDGLDNDCDGRPDEDYSTEPDPLNREDSGLRYRDHRGDVVRIGRFCTGHEGICADAAGRVECSPDQAGTQCSASPGGSEYLAVDRVEVCDGLDNDCDGRADNDLVDTRQPCSTGVGECEAEGFTACEQEQLVCLAVPLDPSDEDCDGLDNDCDGEADEDDGGGPLARSCNDGDEAERNVGECRDATEACVDGAWTGVCVGEVLPADEQCNGLDDDCDGIVDNLPGEDPPCEVGAGECFAEGQIVCVEGELVCSVVAGDPEEEACDDLDNDCDGLTDETFRHCDPDDPEDGCVADPQAPALGDACAVGLGPCRNEGTYGCEDGALVCDADPFNVAQQEVCDGEDNDCDDLIDEDGVDDPLPGVGAACFSGQGVCRAAGNVVCVDGVLSCNGVPGQPGVEVCRDGLDNDCDGLVDNEVPDGFDNDCDGHIDNEVCDGQDNDGDFEVDEDPGDVGGLCGVGDGACITVCDQGQILCRPAPGLGGLEVHDGVDNDCDGLVDNEVCDGLDNDDNDLVDDDPSDVGGPCGGNLGQCLPGVWACDGGQRVCQGGLGPVPETCNGLDDDCDGALDDEPTDAGGCCVVGSDDPCSDDECHEEGSMACVNGQLSCIPTPAVPPPPAGQQEQLPILVLGSPEDEEGEPVASMVFSDATGRDHPVPGMNPAYRYINDPVFVAGMVEFPDGLPRPTAVVTKENLGSIDVRDQGDQGGQEVTLVLRGPLELVEGTQRFVCQEGPDGEPIGLGRGVGVYTGSVDGNQASWDLYVRERDGDVEEGEDVLGRRCAWGEVTRMQVFADYTDGIGEDDGAISIRAWFSLDLLHDRDEWCAILQEVSYGGQQVGLLVEGQAREPIGGIPCPGGGPLCWGRWQIEELNVWRLAP